MSDAADYAAQLAEYGEMLADGVIAAVPAWVASCVERIGVPAGVAIDPELVRSAGEAAAAEVGGPLRALLASDIDAQATTPLALVRRLVRYPTDLLRQVGVEPLARDRFEVEAFPDDSYRLTPATLAELDEQLADLAIAWGAAKAWEHRRRHSSPG